MKHIRAILSTCLDVLFPRDPRAILCDTLTIETLAVLAGKARAPALNDCIAPLPYRHTLVHSVVYAAKYAGHTRAAYVLGNAIAPFVAEELAERQMFGTFHNPLFLAVPLHKNRFRKRGFNQSERILCALREGLGDVRASTAPGALVRIRETQAQARSADKNTRLKNMRNAFLVVGPEGVQGKDIILVDDVITTGATFSEARKALLTAGARNVLCVAAAH